MYLIVFKAFKMDLFCVNDNPWTGMARLSLGTFNEAASDRFLDIDMQVVSQDALDNPALEIILLLCIDRDWNTEYHLGVSIRSGFTWLLLQKLHQLLFLLLLLLRIQKCHLLFHALALHSFDWLQRIVDRLLLFLDSNDI